MKYEFISLGFSHHGLNMVSRANHCLHGYEFRLKLPKPNPEKQATQNQTSPLVSEPKLRQNTSYLHIPKKKLVEHWKKVVLNSTTPKYPPTALNADEKRKRRPSIRTLNTHEHTEVKTTL